VTSRGRLGWLDVAERGSAAGLGFLVVLSTLGGRAPTRAFLRLVVPYYLAAHAPARRASRAYLARVHAGARATLPMVHDHILRFAQCTLDRLFFVQGKVGLFEVHSHGEEHLTALLDRGRGALLLGAHLGSFEAMQRMADARRIPINVVGFFRNARLLAAVLERLNPEANARLIEVERGREGENVDFVLKIRERIERGELVALLADRTWPGDPGARVDFLGGTARFPTGPYRLAAALGCPVLLAFGLHTPPNRYDLYCEPFADRIVLPSRARRRAPERDAALAGLAQRFAGRLERYCRLAPDNWFNFYDFWDDWPGGVREREGAGPWPRRSRR
jgi:predicted LPLAT superfamily acyltransferase